MVGSLLNQNGQKNAISFFEFFGFERPLLRYLLKTVLHCKTGWMRFKTVVAIFKRLCALSFFPFWRSNREDFYLPLAQQNENKPEFKMYQPSNQSMVPIFKPFPRIPSYFYINVFWALWQFYSKQTGQNREFKMEIWKVCNILTFKVRSKTKSCFEDLRAKGIIMVKKNLSRKMRTHFWAFEDSKSLFSSKC